MDEDTLISKKEVLELTGISYGQFYRWKRKGLIPESWFLRKSTFTGQETFLPRVKVLERIDKIQQLKDDHSLEELAQVLAPEVSGRDFSADEVAEMGWISAEVRDFFDTFRQKPGGYMFHEILFLTVIEKLRQDLDDDELALVASTLLEHQTKLQQGEEFRWQLLVARKPIQHSLTKSNLGPRLSSCFIYDAVCLLDNLNEVVVQIELHPLLEEIKLKLSGLR